MAVPLGRSEPRSFEQIHEHYVVEKELADRLRRATRQERLHLYGPLYDERNRRVVHHPLLARKASQEETRQAVASQMRLLRRFLTKDTVFLEVGAGDCGVSFEAAHQVRQVYAIDVSDEITRSSASPANFQLILSDGLSVPVPENSVTVAYSHQLMEHLHPDDAYEQLQNIYRSLAPGGTYLCITPNRLNGPHDISKHFDDVATGFHLKEYTVTELAALFQSIGFTRVQAVVGARGLYLTLPLLPLRLLEALLAVLPSSVRRSVCRVVVVPNVKIRGTKPSVGKG